MMRGGRRLSTFSTAALLATIDAHAAVEHEQRRFRDLEVGESAGASLSDFCQLGLIVDHAAGSISTNDPSVMVVERLHDGIKVILNPPPDATDTRSAVDALSMFIVEAGWRTCGPTDETLRVRSTGMRGLDVIDRNGQPDFDFKAGVTP